MIRLRALAAALMLLVLAACTPTDGARPPDNRPPNRPAPTAAAAQGFDVYLEVEVLSALSPSGPGRPILVQVVVTLNVVQTNGQMAVFTDPKTGVKGTSPIVFPRLTPVHYGITFLPGIAFAESIVTHAGPSGEQLSCWYTRDGVEIPNTRHRDIIGPTVSGTGGALVTCHYNAPT